MKTTIFAFLKKHTGLFLVIGGVGGYVLISGTTGSCGACSAVTNALGIPSLIGSAHASEPTSAQASAWKLKDLDGKDVSSTEFKGKVVMIDFWATWCPPCRLMIPGMVELQEKYRDQGFAIVGISLDQGGPEAVKAFNKEFKVNYTSLMGTEGVVQAFGGVQGIPTSFLLDREGRIVSKHVGYVSKEALEGELKPLF